MLQINEKSPASSPMIIHNTYPCYSSNNQKNVLLSNATPIGVHKMQIAYGRCWTVVSRFDSTNKYFFTHDENQTKISQELLV